MTDPNRHLPSNLPEQPRNSPESSRPVTKEKSKRGVIIAGAAGLALVAGGFLAGNMNRDNSNETNNENLPPHPGRVATAPVHPTEVTPTASETAPVLELLPPEEMLFFNEDGTTQTREELAASIELTLKEVPSSEIQDRIFVEFDEMVGHTMSLEEIAHNTTLDSVDDITDLEYEAASRARADVYYETLFDSPSGGMYEIMDELRQKNIAGQLQDRNFHLDITSLPANMMEGRARNAFVVTSNGQELGLPELGEGTYQFTWSSGEGIIRHMNEDYTKETWNLKGNMKIKKVEQ